MDNRRTPGSGDSSRYVSEVGTDTVPVKLVELQSVGGTKRRNPVPIVVVALAVVAVVAFGLGTSFGKPPSASPTAPAAAVSSDGPSQLAATWAPTARVTLSPTLAPTALPTNPNEWTWNRTTFVPGEPFGFARMWGIGDRIIALGHHADDSGRTLWATAVLDAPDISTWNVEAAPPAIRELRGVSVIDERLWALAKVEGVGEEQATWQLVSTTGGSDWTALGPARGLKAPEDAAFVARTPSAWVIGLSGDAAVSDGDAHLFSSSDGVMWREASLPKLPGRRPVDFFGAGRLADNLLVLGRGVGDSYEETTFVLTSSNGTTWRSVDLRTAKGESPTDLACINELCLTVTNSFVEPSGQRHVVTSYDGTHWTKTPFDLVPGDTDNEIYNLRQTPVGFIAMVGNTGQVVRSFDGVDWQVIPVMPPDRAEYVADLAAGGNVVVAYSQGDTETPPAMWTGLLAALPPAP